MKQPRDFERGFSLVELLIAMAISTIVLAAIAAAFVAGINVTGTSSTRMAQADDRQLVEIWFPRDVQSAQTAKDITNSGATPPDTCARTPTLGGPATALLVLRGMGEAVVPESGGPNEVVPNRYEADYVLSAPNASNVRSLVRYFCLWSSGAASPTTKSKMTVSYDLNAGPSAASVKITSAAGTPTTVSMTLEDASGNLYSLSASERS